MKIILIALALITNAPFSRFTETRVLQTPAASTQRPVQITARYNKKKDITRLFLQPLFLWGNLTPRQYEDVRLYVGFECRGKKIARPKEVLFSFSSSSENFVSFPSLDFSVSIDGALLELGKLKGRQRNKIDPVDFSRTIYEDESTAISYEYFTRIATANEVTIIIGKRKFDLPSEDIRLLREFHKLMQREGQEIK
ncbi:MAG TPA: hypothetical protein VFR78_10265 [Pyrinomonadaceae bacterium]|nr:hypothetical protein [Pyrinomonadaceae bacterium]